MSASILVQKRLSLWHRGKVQRLWVMILARADSQSEGREVEIDYFLDSTSSLASNLGPTDAGDRSISERTREAEG
jgi:hypothetical protein